MTLAATVRAAALRFGPRAALVDPDGARLSYAELDARSGLSGRQSGFPEAGAPNATLRTPSTMSSM